MADLDTSGGGKHKGGKVRSKKASTLVLTLRQWLTLPSCSSLSLCLPLHSLKERNGPGHAEMTPLKQTTLPINASRSMTISCRQPLIKLEWYYGRELVSRRQLLINYGKGWVA